MCAFEALALNPPELKQNKQSIQVYRAEPPGHEGSPDTAWFTHWHGNQERDWTCTGSMKALALRRALAAGARRVTPKGCWTTTGNSAEVISAINLGGVGAARQEYVFHI